jgi:hypothetical protein
MRMEGGLSPTVVRPSPVPSVTSLGDRIRAPREGMFVSSSTTTEKDDHMCHNTLRDLNFYAFLLSIDQKLADTMQAAGCRYCGSALHKNRYERKPRGGGLINLGKPPHYHLSLTCSKCEKRHNPASVRFFGRRVFVAAIVVLASTLQDGLIAGRVAQLGGWLCVPRRTIARWRAWWLRDFMQSPFWKNARSQFMPPVTAGTLPDSLLERFAGPDLAAQLVALLRFLTPLRE